MRFSFKDFFSKCDQIRRKTANLVTFTEEILNGKLHFCAVAVVNLLRPISIKKEQHHCDCSLLECLPLISYMFELVPTKSTISTQRQENLNMSSMFIDGAKKHIANF